MIDLSPAFDVVPKNRSPMHYTMASTVYKYLGVKQWAKGEHAKIRDELMDQYGVEFIHRSGHVWVKGLVAKDPTRDLIVANQERAYIKAYQRRQMVDSTHTLYQFALSLSDSDAISNGNNWRIPPLSRIQALIVKVIGK